MSDGRHHLHGGTNGFDKRLWDSRAADDRVTFQLRSDDGDGGYPGQLDATVTYSLDDACGLTVEYTAVATGAATVVNLTQHAYFNLSGCSRPIFDTAMQIEADAILATDADNVPTGELRHVEGTRFDFRVPRPLAPPGATAATCVQRKEEVGGGGAEISHGGARQRLTANVCSVHLAARAAVQI